MAEGRSAFAWNHTSSVLALIANVNRDPKKTRAFTPAHFNPHDARHTRRKQGISVARLTREIMAIAEAKKRKAQAKATKGPRA